MTKTKETEVLLQVSPTIRIIRSDAYNLAIERLEAMPAQTIMGKLYPERESWVLKGYYNNKLQALEGILSHDLLDDENEVLEFKDFVQQIKDTHSYTVKQLREMLS